MPTILQTTQGTVTGLWGSAIVKGADGRARPLKMGDIVRRGDVILTTQDGIVQLTSDPSAIATPASAVDPAALATAPAKATATAATAGNDVDQVIEKLAQNDADAATAAGLTAGDGGEFLPGLRVDRIAELLTPLNVDNNEGTSQDLDPVFATEGPSADTLANIAPSALDASVSGPENTTLPVVLRGIDSDGNVVSVTVATLPTGGTLLLADGSTVVSAGQTLTPAQAAGLLFRPAADFVGQAVITFFVTDNQGSTSDSATVSLNVGSTNPPPNQAPVAINDSAVVAEDAPANGNVLDNDSDPDDNPLTVTQFVIEGVTYAAGATAVVAGIGSLTLAADGAYTFTPLANYNGPVPVATYTVSDGVASVTATLTLSVSPEPDPAIVGGVATGATVEETTLTTGGTLTVTDPDAGEAAFNPLSNVSAPNGHGTFSIDAAGVWTYTLNNADPAVQALGAGQTLPNETFTVTTIDGTSQVVTVTITGTNDVPVAQGASISVNEDAPLFTGNVIATDADANAVLAFSLNSAPPAGLTFNTNGSYTFDASNAAYQSLAVGQTQVLTIPYTVTDDQGATSTANLVITITGTNDAAVIGGIAVGSVTEDGVAVASGTLTVSDVDSPASFVAANASGTYGDFTVDAAGAWSYTLRNADANVQALTSAQHPIESFAVTSTDGTTSTVTVTVNGANEAPVAVVTPASGNEDAAGIPVLLGGTDIDGSIASFTIASLPTNGVLLFGGNPVVAGQVITATAGSATLSFVPAANFNGSTAFDFTATDNEGAVSPSVNVPISVAAVADPAVIGGVANGATVEETTLTTGGTLTVTDPDAGEAAFNPLSNVRAPNGHGTFSIDAAGVWTYTLNNADPAVQALGAGQTLPNETFTVTTIDGTSQVVTVTITGTNDVPVAQGASVSVNEDAPLFTGSVIATDVDANAVLSFGLNGAPPAGLTFNPDGSYTFDAANPAYQSLAAGQQLLLTIPYTVTDDQGATSTANLVITITGTNDAAVISAGTGSVTEDVGVVGGNLTTGGTLTVSDADVGQATIQAQVATAGAYGTFTLAANGNWTYTATNSNPTIQALGTGQSLSETFTVLSADGTTSTVTVTVNGANEAPVAVVTPASGNEDAAGIPVLLGGTDVDGSIASFTIASLPTNGVLLFGGNPVVAGQVITATAGSATLSFVPAANFNGSTAFDFTATDNEGVVSPSVNAPITVSADNDAPVAVNDSFVTVEDAPVTINVRDNDGDADGDPLTITQVNGSPITAGGAGIAVTGGVVTLNGAGNLVFTPTLNYNGTPSFTYTVADPTGATSTATVSGTVTPQNDAPVARLDDGNVTASQTLIVSAAEGVIQSTSVAAGRDTDVDGDVLSVTSVSAGTGAPTTPVPSGGVNVAGTYGDLLLRNDGSYTYVASRANAVPTGTQVNDVFTYQVSDGNGGFATASLTLHVGGTADTLTAAPPTTATLNATLGLGGEYYGYNDFNPGPTSPNRRHADDGLYGNLDSAADLTAIVNGRNAVYGGGAVAGSSAATAPDAADARFLARTVDYGGAPAVTSSLGTNSNIAAGGSTAGMTNNNSQLYRFLNRAGGGDTDTVSVRLGTADNDQLGGGPTSGLGRTSDAAIRLSGQAYLAAGLYDIRVLADDGFRLRLNNQTVAAFDNIQSPTTRVYTGVPIDGGLTPLELLYWEQGGNAVLRIEFKPSGSADTAYQLLGSQNLPLFSDANAPVLSPLQDIVAGPTPGSYLVRTGSLLDGGNGDDTLTGSAGRDILIGGQGRDTLIGGAGDDTIRGGSGDDQLTGGAGHDVFRWSLGDAGSAGAPARDVISDFDNTPHGGDVLDLRDLLVGELHAANTVGIGTPVGLTYPTIITSNEGNLANYLHFSTVGGNTVVEISSTGGFSGSYTPAAVDQVITLTGLNLVGSFSNDNQVINDLLQRGKLVTD